MKKELRKQGRRRLSALALCAVLVLSMLCPAWAAPVILSGVELDRMAAEPAVSQEETDAPAADTKSESTDSEDTGSEVSPKEENQKPEDEELIDGEPPLEEAPEVFFEGEGTEDDPYQIAPDTDLWRLAELVNSGEEGYAGANYLLTGSFLSEEEWTPIGTVENPFSGTFDGGGNTLYLAGRVFGAVSNAEVRDLNVYSGVAETVSNSTFVNCLSDGTIDGSAMAVTAAGSTFTGCVNQGTVTGGGIVGTATDCVFEDCLNQGAVEGAGNVGGIAGTVKGSISFVNCANEGSVTGTGSNIGGIAGSVTGTAALTGCVNRGTVTGGNYTGGVAGSLGANCTASGCYNAGAVTGGGTYTGGVFGEIKYASGKNEDITNCWNSGNVESSGSYVGGVIGNLPGSYQYLSGYSITLPKYLYNVGTVTGTGGSTCAAGICGNADKGFSYVSDSFSWGSVTGPTAAGITAAGYTTTVNSYYNADAVPEAADSEYAVGLTAEQFASGEAAWRLDRGGTAERTALWGQGDGHPVPADEDHPALYRLTVTAEGPEEGFAAPEPEQPEQPEMPEPPEEAGTEDQEESNSPDGDANPDGTPEEPIPVPPVNAVGKGGTVTSAETLTLALYIPAGETALTYTLKEGYQLERVTVDPASVRFVLDQEAQTIAVTMPEADAELAVTFAEVPRAPEGGESVPDCTVTFDANGGGWDGEETLEVTVRAGGMVSAPPAPRREADETAEYAFTGWYADPACTGRYNFSTAVRGDLTLYAGWAVTPIHTVTFDANGGLFDTGLSTQEIRVKDGGRVSGPAAPIWEGHTFRGWFTDPAGTRACDFSVPVEESFTLYAGWAEDGKIVVVFDANGGVIPTEDGGQAEVLTLTGTAEEPVAVPADPVREADGLMPYLFKGWQRADGSLLEGDTVSESMTLTARWEKGKAVADLQAGETYYISCLEDLVALRDAVKAQLPNNAFPDTTFILTDNIELPADWTAIGPYKFNRGTWQGNDGSFSGIFDGGGYTITLSPGQTQCLFGAISGTVKNLTIKGDNSSVPAGVALSCAKGRFEDVTIDAKLTGAYAGVVYFVYANGIFERCTVKSGSVISNSAGPAGGIVAIANSSGTQEFTDCVVETGVRITGAGNGELGSVGGIVGYCASTFDRCYSGADLTATSPDAAIGGIAGFVNSAAVATIKDSYATGSITAKQGGTVGGLIGRPYSGSQANHIENSYFYGAIYSSGTIIPAGVIGDSRNDSGENTGKAGTVVKNTYFCVTNDVTVQEDDSFGAPLPASAFIIGKAAWLLDTDGGTADHKGIWGQDEVLGRPVLGGTPCSPVTLTAEGEGTASIDSPTDEDGLYYFGAGASVTVDAVPAEYTENEAYGPQYEYQLTKLIVNGEDVGGDTFPMPGGAAEVVAVFEAVQVDDIPEPEPGPGPSEGDGAGTGGDGQGAGGGSDSGLGELPGTGDGQDANPEGPGSGDAAAGDPERTGPETDLPAEDVPLTQLPAGPAEEPAVPDAAPAEDIPESDVPTAPLPPPAAPGAAGQEDGGAEQTPQLTVFELIQRTVRENPMAAALALAGCGAILALAVLHRVRLSRREK